MSYILDALKKSEQERKKGEIPGLDTIQDFPTRKNRRSRPPWLMIIVAAFALNVLLFGIWIHSERSATPESEIATIASDETETKIAPAETSAAPATENAQLPSISADISGEEMTIQSAPETPDATAEIAASSQPEAESALSDVEAEPVVTDTAPQQPIISAEEIAASPQPEAESALFDVEAEPVVTDTAPQQPVIPAEEIPSSTEKVEEAERDKPIPFKDLSADIKSDLPEIKISLHFFSADRTNRRVSINGRMMREESEVAQGLMLKEITKNGVIFSYRDTLFLYDVFSR